MSQDCRNIGLWHKTIVGMVGKDVWDYGNCVILIYLQYIEPQKRADMFSLGTTGKSRSAEASLDHLVVFCKKSYSKPSLFISRMVDSSVL